MAVEELAVKDQEGRAMSSYRERNPDSDYEAEETEATKSQDVNVVVNNNDKQESVIPASPPQFVPMHQLTKAANAFYEMSLAHEITIDSDFRLEKFEPSQQSLAGVIKETMHRAFWDVLRSSLEADPPDYEPAIRLLIEVKESLSGLVLPNQATLQRRIDESFDIDALRETLASSHPGSVNLSPYLGKVVDLMQQFCAPIRDEAVNALRTFTDPVEAFRNAFLLLETMHMDLANFTIAQMRPYIRQHAVAYERAKFADFIKAQQAVGLDGLLLTRKWFQRAHDQLVEINTASSRDATNNRTSPTSPVNIAESDLTPNNLVREAFLLLLLLPNPSSQSLPANPATDTNNDVGSPRRRPPAVALTEWPETMVMDQHRLLELGVQLGNIVVVTSLVLLACNQVAESAPLLFPNETTRELIRSRPEAMTVLKRAICRDALMMIENCPPHAPQANSSSSSGQPNHHQLPPNVIPDQLILSVERWYSALTSASSPNLPNNNNKKEVEEFDRVNITLGTGNLPTSFRTQLHARAVDVVEQRSPVFHLMYSSFHPSYQSMISTRTDDRAVNFLRLALSSHPPEPLPIPAGFSVLNDANALAAASAAATAVPPTMASGLVGGPSSASPTPIANSSEPRRQPLSLTDLAGRLLPLLVHNRHVFGQYYSELAQQLLSPTTTTTNSTVPVAAE